ncbi:hypothetical protein HMPREF9440_02543 [Sutterella parvirubra YIT 11816]|uniref:Uncharacterized protein n=1 Tax=Sutterella parvirubra YIT 11816 TaxID=762967 RepID=H3KID1_9BURK|nr:hypothetical protein HMPREF9440_02543 [Sutterella parvirubra YIT 11816]
METIAAALTKEHGRTARIPFKPKAGRHRPKSGCLRHSGPFCGRHAVSRHDKKPESPPRPFGAVMPVFDCASLTDRL